MKCLNIGSYVQQNTIILSSNELFVVSQARRPAPVYRLWERVRHRGANTKASRGTTARSWRPCKGERSVESCRSPTWSIASIWRPLGNYCWHMVGSEMQCAESTSFGKVWELKRTLFTIETQYTHHSNRVGAVQVDVSANKCCENLTPKSKDVCILEGDALGSPKEQLRALSNFETYCWL